jgi:hypothetical protein
MSASAHVIVASFEIKMSISLKAYQLWSKMFFARFTKECTKFSLIPRKSKNGD